jgi:hypothetical protein
VKLIAAVHHAMSDSLRAKACSELRCDPVACLSRCIAVRFHVINRCGEEPGSGRRGRLVHGCVNHVKLQGVASGVEDQHLHGFAEETPQQKESFTPPARNRIPGPSVTCRGLAATAVKLCSRRLTWDYSEL